MYIFVRECEIYMSYTFDEGILAELMNDQFKKGMNKSNFFTLAYKPKFMMREALEWTPDDYPRSRNDDQLIIVSGKIWWIDKLPSGTWIIGNVHP